MKVIQSEISNEKWVGEVTRLMEQDEVFGEKSFAEKGFHFLKMKWNDENWYMVFNTGNAFKDEWVELNSDTKSYVIMNPMNGEISKAKTQGNALRFQLEKEQSVFIRCTDVNIQAPQFSYQENNSQPNVEGTLWKVEFLDGGPVYPGNLQMDDLVSWTVLGDHEAERFAGTVLYSTKFSWEGKSRSAIMNLGEVKDCARIILNGEIVGTLLGPVFKLKVDNLVQGQNTLEIEVTNVAANRIRDLDKKGVVWRKFKDINLVNIDYEPFNASVWEIKEAGLLGPFTITEL